MKILDLLKEDYYEYCYSNNFIPSNSIEEKIIHIETSPQFLKLLNQEIFETFGNSSYIINGEPIPSKFYIIKLPLIAEFHFYENERLVGYKIKTNEPSKEI